MDTQPCIVDSVGPINQGSHLLIALFWAKDETDFKTNSIEFSDFSGKFT